MASGVLARKKDSKSASKKTGSPIKTRAGHPKTRDLGRPTVATPAIAEIRRMIGFSQPEFGRMTSYSTRAVAGWESGKAIDSRARRRVTEIQRLLNALSQLMPPGQLGPWLRESNDAFNGHSPLQLIEQGELDRLWQMIYQIDANVAN